MCTIELSPNQIARLARVYYATTHIPAGVISASNSYTYQDLARAGWVKVTETAPHLIVTTPAGVRKLHEYSRLQRVISLLDEGYFTEAVPLIESLERKDLCELLTYPMALIRRIARVKMELLS